MTTIVAFGDSLSDPGNLFALSSLFVGPGGLAEPIPSAPYVGGHFSNGPTAIEIAATRLGATLIDKAYGGAETGFTNGQFAGLPPALDPLYNTGLRSQVAGYIAGSGGGGLDPSALYFVWAGANDWLHGGFADPGGTITNGVTNLTLAVQDLYLAGARRFLLPNMVDLGITPRTLALGPAAAGGATGASIAFNNALFASYAGLAALLPDEDFIFFDAFAASEAAVATSAAAGMDVTMPCIGAGANPDCSNHFFFDDVHPTTFAHGLFAAGFVAAVPEPDSLLLVGAVALGWMARSARRRRSSTMA